MRLRAFAKINLGLDILRKREDGYHEVRMIMQTIQMYDVLEMKKVKKPGISLSVNYPYIPSDERNLVYKAAKLLMDEFQVKEGVDIRLEKFIPVAAGMAGGSSDAAAAMVGINHLFKLGLSEKDLMDRAVNIGADVPYCIMRGTALAEGIGEKLTRIAQVPDCYVLIGGGLALYFKVFRKKKNNDMREEYEEETYPPEDPEDENDLPPWEE